MKNIVSKHSNIHVTKKIAAFDTAKKKRTKVMLTDFMCQVAEMLEARGHIRTKEIYISTLKSFMAFRQGKDIALAEINSDIMTLYESYLFHNRGISRNSSSFYMRAFRAVYNRAVNNGLVVDSHPFKDVYTGIDKTVKRALPLKVIKQIKNLDLSLLPSLDFARDMFLFSFYTRGMSFVDMAYLRKSNLKNGVLSYRRRKTGQLLHVKWEKCMQSIVDKWGIVTSDYLLPIIVNENKNERLQYQSALCTTNMLLKELATMIGLSQPLTTYVARHSWASIAHSKNIPLSVISECMGHDSEKTTQIYLASLESTIVDKANSLVLNALHGK